VHPIGALLSAAAHGRFPVADGGWERVAPWRDDVEAVVSFTGRAVLAVGEDVDDETLVALGPDGFGGAHHPRLVCALAGPAGWVDCLDAVLVARGTGGTPQLSERDDLLEHPRVVFARRRRDDVRVLADDQGHGLVTLGTGLGGLTELSIEVTRPGQGHGRTLLARALAGARDGEVVCAAVAPGNAASLRCFVAAGFAPVASVQLYEPRR
jgi:hypothetical protein